MNSSRSSQFGGMEQLLGDPMKISMLALLFLSMTTTFSGAQEKGTPNPGNSNGIPASAGQQKRLSQAGAPRYRLREGDSFDIQFAFAPEFNETVSVQPDGYITLKSLGTILAEGLTVPEITQKIEQSYAGILHDQQITISLKDFEKPYFLATGQVGKPGKYELRSDLTIIEGIAVAGGLTESSKHSQVVLFRPLPNGLTEAHLIDVKKMLTSRNLS